MAARLKGKVALVRTEALSPRTGPVRESLQTRPFTKATSSEIAIFPGRHYLPGVKMSQESELKISISRHPEARRNDHMAFFEFIGRLTLFGAKALRDIFRPPFEFEYFLT